MNIGPEEARAALSAADAGHRVVVDEVGVPAWYWWGLGVSWVVIGVVADRDIWWLTGLVTLLVGAAHASVFGRVAGGRRRTAGLSVGRAAAGPHTALYVWLLLVALVVLGVVVALFVAHDGAAHPATIASLLPAAIVISGGPSVVRWSARRDGRTARGKQTDRAVR
jgi:hypothetical protein